MGSDLDECPESITNFGAFHAALNVAEADIRVGKPGALENFLALKGQFEATRRSAMTTGICNGFADRIRRVLLQLNGNNRVVKDDDVTPDYVEGYGDTDAGPHHYHTHTRLAR